MIAGWLLAASLTWAGPVDASAVGQALLALAGSDVPVSDAFLDRHIDPGPGGWSEDRRAIWRHALRPEGLARRTLRDAPAPPPDPTEPAREVLFDTQPALVATLAGDGRMRALAPAACVDCSPVERWVRGLLVDLRRDPAHSPRLRVQVDLDLTDVLDANPRLRSARWPSMLDRRLHDDVALRERIAAATLTRVEGPVATVRYPDGTLDRWTLRWQDGYAAIVYDALPAGSPLRLSADEARRWRRTSWRGPIRNRTWRPTWRTHADGSIELAHDTAALAVDPTDATVLALVLTADRTLATLVRVDPWTRQVLDRIPLPEVGSRRHLPVPGWTGRWPLALDAPRRRVALVTPAGLAVVDLSSGEVEDRGRPRPDITALAWTADGALLRGHEDGTVSLDGAPLVEQTAAPVRLITLDDGQPLRLDADGHLLRADGIPPGSPALRCRDGVISAHAQPDRGRWRAQCADGSLWSVSPDDGHVAPLVPSTTPGAPSLIVDLEDPEIGRVVLDATGHVRWWDPTRARSAPR